MPSDPDKRRRLSQVARLALLSSLLAAGAHAALAAGERLAATGGLMEFEGAAGGGLTPWALIGGLETDRGIGLATGCTAIRPQHFALDACGLAAGIHDRLELSYARQRFSLDDVAPGQDIRLDVIGAKWRLSGDAIYDQDRDWPQLAAGVQYKRNRDFGFVPALVGARHASDTDFYISASKLYLDGPLHRSWIANATLRATRANQFGILGFGSARDDSRHLELEASLGVFLADGLAFGAEFRQRPNLLASFREQDAHDLFLAWFPGKHLSATLAYVALGNIATHRDQDAAYLSLQGAF